MPRATISRRDTAHTAAVLSNGAPSADLSRESTGRVRAQLSLEEQGVA